MRLRMHCGLSACAMSKCRRRRSGFGGRSGEASKKPKTPERLSSDGSPYLHTVAGIAAHSKERPMYAFDYHRPKTMKEAVSLLRKVENAKPLAGGQSLVAALK